MRAQFSAVRFQNPAQAEANPARLERHLGPALLATLGSLLAQSPDPDGALDLLERYAQAAGPETLGEIERLPSALTYLVAIFGYSAFLAETFLTDPALAIQLARDRNFTKLKSKEDLMQDFARFSTTSPDPWLSARLARFKQRNQLRIALKDVLRLSTLGETTLELSALADVVLTNALLYCDLELEKRHGQPQYRDPQGRVARAAGKCRCSSRRGIRRATRGSRASSCAASSPMCTAHRRMSGLSRARSCRARGSRRSCGRAAPRWPT